MPTMSWQHTNLQDEFYFSDEALTEALHVDLADLLTVECKVADQVQPM